MALAKARDWVSKLTLEEKSAMTTGAPGPCVGNIIPIPRLGFSGLCLQDGPLAIRVANYASVFQAGVTTAASFDRALMYERGQMMGAEFKGKGAHVALGYIHTPYDPQGYFANLTQACRQPSRTRSICWEKLGRFLPRSISHWCSNGRNHLGSPKQWPPSLC